MYTRDHPNEMAHVLLLVDTSISIDAFIQYKQQQSYQVYPYKYIFKASSCKLDL